MRVTLNSLAAVLMTCATVMSAGVPNSINYQSRITDAAGAPLPDGTITVTFQIYDAATGGTVLWNSGSQTVTTIDGFFSYGLGSNVVLPDLFGTDSIRYLGITVGTDPEISPRTRFTSSGYGFRSLKSDLSLNSDSLGGLQPSFYLDWSNLTGVPAGFADGIDDGGGISQSDADSLYLRKLGDTIRGGLDIDFNGDGISDGGFENFSGTPNLELRTLGQLKSKLWGALWGELDLYDEDGDLTLFLHASAPEGGRLQIHDRNGAPVIGLSAVIGQNDLSVFFPDSAINSNEMFDEPGLATNVSSARDTLLVGAGMVDLVTVQITIPNSGYIRVEGECFMNFLGSSGPGSAAFQIDQTAGGSHTAPYYNYAGFESGFSSSGAHIFPINASRTYFKNAGTYTFRLEGRRFFSTGIIIANYPKITAVYYPTAYGSVTAVAEQPGDHPKAEPITVNDINGNSRTAYKMDLRYYEEKARAARIAEQKALLAKTEAELELARARQTSKQD